MADVGYNDSQRCWPSNVGQILDREANVVTIILDGTDCGAQTESLLPTLLARQYWAHA